MRSPYLLAILALATAAGCSKSKDGGTSGTVSPNRKVRIEMASFVSSGVNVIGEQATHLAEEFERVSGGMIQTEIFEPGALVGAMEILDAVSEGKVDAGYGTPGFWAGKIPAASFFSAVPFGPDTSEFIAWLFQGNGMTLYQEMYDDAGFDVKVLVCSIIPPETSGWFKNEINSVEDLQGLKMRAFGLGALVLEKLGVSISVLPGGEIFPALEKGVVDATEYSLPSIDESQGFYKLAKYNYYPGWHQQSTVFEIIFHKGFWNRLSGTQQAQIEAVCQAGIVHSIAYCEGIQAATIKRNEERGVHTREWSPEMLARFKEAWLEVAAEESAKDAGFKKVWEDLQSFRSEYRTWSERAYLR